MECGTEFTNTFGDIDMKFYNSLCSVYHAVINAVFNQKENTMFQKFADRLYGVVYDSRGIGWGYHDYVAEEYYRLPWIENNEQD